MSFFARSIFPVVFGLATWLASQALATEIHLSPTGDDNNPGTSAKPLASLSAAQKLARTFVGHEPVTVLLEDGTYYLPVPLKITADDSGTEKFPVTYTAAPGAHPVISGGVRLKLTWKPYRNGIFQAPTPPGLVWDQLFVNGQRQHLARYPNFNPQGGQFGGSAADAISPERVARWADPAGGFIHAMHRALWGDMHYRILGKNPDGSLRYEGGWQNNRPSGMHPKFRFVENIFEELDAPGEWFHNQKTSTLYFMPPPGLNLDTAVIETVQLAHLVEFNGSAERPAKFVTLRGLTFRHAARTFMENREPILRSDWTVYRGGAVFFDGAEDDTIENCDFDQLGGNAIFASEYNRRIVVRGCLIQDSGANGIAFVGDPKAVRSPVFNYDTKYDYTKLDHTPGPIGNNFPANCLVEDCLITRSGRFEKQTAPVEIDLAQNITVRHCSIYDVPRAGINIGDGCWGGHLIEFCDIFDTVLETGDHGSFNSWGRDRYWHSNGKTVENQVAADPQLPFLDVVAPITLRNNRWRCDHGWDIDLDDGSSNYRIYNNLLLHGGLKLREGYSRVATNNIIVNNSLHPHVWFVQSADVFARNIVMGAYRPALMTVPHWGQQVDYNMFTTSLSDRQKFAAKGCDAHSLVGDAQFVNPAAGDFQVQATSPALKLGFVNFPMDQFGVQSPRLKALARTPVITLPTGSGLLAVAAQTNWLGASLRDLVGEEYSALGLAVDARGVLVAQAPNDSDASHAGLQTGDFIEQMNGRPVKNLADFCTVLAAVPPDQKLKLELIRNYQPKTIEFPALKASGILARSMTDPATYGFSPNASGVDNTKALQRAVDQGGTIIVSQPGIYPVAGTVFVGSHTSLIFGNGVFLKKVAEQGDFTHVLLNKGALTRTYDEDITVEGLQIIVNGVDVRHFLVYGLHGQLAFFYVKDLKIDRFRCLDLGRAQYGIQVCAFEDLLIHDVVIKGLKDGVHLGRGQRFTISHGVFQTGDDAIALNGHDYAVGNPEMGWIQDGVIENCHDLDQPNHRVGYFCRILAGAWTDWHPGMEVQQSDTVVSSGRLYRVQAEPDGKKYISLTPPTHLLGSKILEGINWGLVQTNVTYTAGVRNVTFRDIFLEKPRTAFSIHFDNDKYSRSYYPGAKIPQQEQLVFDNIRVLYDQKIDFLSVGTPVDVVTIANSSLRNNRINFHGNHALPDYLETKINLVNCVFNYPGTMELLANSVPHKVIHLKTFGSVEVPDNFSALVTPGEGKITVESDLTGLKK